MRIAIDGSTWSYSRGFGRYTRGLARALVRVAPTRDLTLVLDATSDGRTDLPDMSRVRVPTRRADLTPQAEGSRSVLDMWRMSRALSRFDTVVFPTLDAYVPVYPRSRVAVVIHDVIRDASPDLVSNSRSERLRWRAKRWLGCRQAGVIATTTDTAARAIRSVLPIGERAIVVLGAGVDPGFGPEAAPDDPPLVAPWVSAGPRVVLYVGALGPHKRVPALVEAFGTLAGDPGGTDLLLVLVGARESLEPERAALRRAIEAIGEAGSRVVRTGLVPDRVLAALYRRASCLVLPSAVEGLGLPVLEAMASGTPVVAARIPALEEVCADAALFFDDLEGLPRALNRVLEDEEVRTRLAREGPARAAAFGWDEAARRLLASLDG